MPNRMIRVHRTPVGIARRCFFCVHMSARKSRLIGQNVLIETAFSP